MIKRVFAVAAVAVAALVSAGLPATAQTYPPPQNSITVDDSTPAAGQSIAVTLRTCRPGTIALFGIGLSLVGAPTVGADGVARATVTVPARLRPGRHVVSGACLSPTWRPLFLTTVITVTGSGAGTSSGSGGGAVPGGGGGSGAAPAAAGGTAAAAATGGGTAGDTAPSQLAALAGPGVPADAPAMFEAAAEANGVTEDGTTDRSGSGTATVARSVDRDAAGAGPGTMSTIARVALGLAALGGVPVALAFSRRPPRTSVERGFA